MKITEARISNNLENRIDPLIKTAIFAGNGIFEEQKSWLGISTKKVNKYELGKEYPNIDESLEIHNKQFDIIPDKALKEVIKWYRDITLDNGEEAQVNFYRLNGKSKTFTLDEEEINLEDIPGIKFWNDNVFSYTPEQHNSGALTEVAESDKYYNRLNEYYGMYVETHSHNSMSAFRSGTDKEYSYNDGIQLVIGKLNTEQIEMYSWVCVRGVQKAGLSLEELSRFVELENVEYDETSNKVIFNTSDIDSQGENEDWYKQVIKKPVVVPSYKYNKQASFYDNNYNWGDYKWTSYKKTPYMSKQKKIESIEEQFLSLVPLELEDIANVILESYIRGLEHTTYIRDIKTHVDELIDLISDFDL